MFELGLVHAPGKGETFILFIQEMLVDIFGSLIPGFCFIFLAVTALGLPLLDLGVEIGSLQQLTQYLSILERNSTAALISVFLFSFVVGHVLYRQNPKKLDRRSIEKQKDDILDTGCVRCRVNGDDEYPYGHLKEYLQERGFERLADQVGWSGADFRADASDKNTQSVRKRSKLFINTRKLEVKNQNSRLYFDILKNEAHIRLISSVWYGAFTLVFISGVGIGLGIIDNAIPACKSMFEHEHIGCKIAPIAHFGALLFPALTLIAAIAGMRSIERFFHYQRVREIVFVLQAWQLSASATQPVRSDEPAKASGVTMLLVPASSVLAGTDSKTD